MNIKLDGRATDLCTLILRNMLAFSRGDQLNMKTSKTKVQDELRAEALENLEF